MTGTEHFENSKHQTSESEGMTGCIGETLPSWVGSLVGLRST